MNGILNILKPPGMTSHDVVSYIRRALKTKKVGHTGTLDPGAAGVLPICIGKGTKVVQYLTDQNKEYICELTLGNKTDTYDKYGKFDFEENKDFSHVTYEMLEETIKDFLGEITQIPPIYSAIKINGRRAYDLAREGIEFEVPSRKVHIYNIDILSFNLPKIMLKISCSKGTYIRSICNDIGEKLNTHAYMSFLLRTKTGPFCIDTAQILTDISLDNVNSIIKPIDFGLDMKKIFIDSEFSDKINNGNPVPINYEGSYNKGEKVTAYLKPDNKFVGVGYIENNLFKVDKLLL